MHCPSCRCLINSCTSEYILLDTFAPRRFRLAHSLFVLLDHALEADDDVLLQPGQHCH